MNLYLQPSLWSCLPTAFGMVMGFQPKQMFEAIGHDGSEIVWPGLPDPHKRRAFHIQECVLVALNNGYFPVEIERESYSHSSEYDIVPFRVPIDGKAFDNQLLLVSGILIGRDLRDKPHAVAWCREEQMIFDPIGSKYSLDQFSPQSFFGIY